MITFLPVLFALLLSAYVLMAPPSVPVKLLWEAETNGQVLAECGFKIYQSTSITIPITNWNVLTNIAATNAQIGGTNFQWALQVVPGQMFYAVTMTNFWGESDFSNTTQTPALPVNPKLKITR